MSNKPRRKPNAGPRTAPPKSRTVAAKKTGPNLPRILAFGGGAVVVAVILAAVIFGGGDEDLPEGPIEGVEFLTVAESGHVEGEIDYGVAVPAGGVHNSLWQNCGFYDGEIREENALHSLEHGAVWIGYRRDVGDEVIDSLRSLSRNRPQLLISEVPSMEVPVTAVAWGVRLELDAHDDTLLRRFIREYTDGPFAPEVPAGCTGGVGVPA